MGPSFEPGFLARMNRMDGRVALMFGGHGEIARAMAAALADGGAALAFAARKQAQCRQLAEEMADLFGVKTMALACDIGDEGQVAESVASVVAQWGRLDILVNNAGTSWSAPTENLPLAGWNKVMAVNLTGAFLAAREAGRIMLAQGAGSIINIASTGGLTSFTPEMAQIVPYTTSKAALIHLTRDLAAQWAGRGVRVNAIAPGQMESGLTLSVPDETLSAIRADIPMRRLGRPMELSAAVAYLACDASSYVTGHTIVIDGGLTLG